MVAHAKLRYITPKEYLRGEDLAESKSEYVNGVIVAMPGATPAHSAITVNLIAAVRPSLRGSNRRVFSNDLRVRIEAGNRYYYPD